MQLTLNLTESPFVLELCNEDGLVTTIDASPEIGGKNKGMRPMQLLAGSLAGCMSIDVLSILRKQRVEISQFSVQIIGNRKSAVPSSFETIELQFSVDAGVPLDKLENAIRLSHDKYCSVSASLHPSIQVITSVKYLS